MARIYVVCFKNDQKEGTFTIEGEDAANHFAAGWLLACAACGQVGESYREMTPVINPGIVLDPAPAPPDSYWGIVEDGPQGSRVLSTEIHTTETEAESRAYHLGVAWKWLYTFRVSQMSGR